MPTISVVLTLNRRFTNTGIADQTVGAWSTRSTSALRQTCAIHAGETIWALRIIQALYISLASTVTTALPAGQGRSRSHSANGIHWPFAHSLGGQSEATRQAATSTHSWRIHSRPSGNPYRFCIRPHRIIHRCTQGHGTVKICLTRLWSTTTVYTRQVIGTLSVVKAAINASTLETTLAVRTVSIDATLTIETNAIETNFTRPTVCIDHAARRGLTQTVQANQSGRQSVSRRQCASGTHRSATHRSPSEQSPSTRYSGVATHALLDGISHHQDSQNQPCIQVLADTDYLGIQNQVGNRHPHDILVAPRIGWPHKFELLDSPRHHDIPMYLRRHHLQHRQTQLGNQCPRGNQRHHSASTQRWPARQSSSTRQPSAWTALPALTDLLRSDNQRRRTLRIGLTCRVNAAKPHHTICSIDAFNAKPPSAPQTKPVSH